MKFTGSTHAGSEQRDGGDYGKEEQYATCPICGQQAKVITGNRYGMHVDGSGGFFCENGGKPVGAPTRKEPR